MRMKKFRMELIYAYANSDITFECKISAYKENLK